MKEIRAVGFALYCCARSAFVQYLVVKNHVRVAEPICQQCSNPTDSRSILTSY